LQPEPDDRYPDMRALIDALRDARQIGYGVSLSDRTSYAQLPPAAASPTRGSPLPSPRPTPTPPAKITNRGTHRMLEQPAEVRAHLAAQEAAANEPASREPDNRRKQLLVGVAVACILAVAFAGGLLSRATTPEGANEVTPEPVPTAAPSEQSESESQPPPSAPPAPSAGPDEAASPAAVPSAPSPPPAKTPRPAPPNVAAPPPSPPPVRPQPTKKYVPQPRPRNEKDNGYW
ncbi:MAG: hypothetical protein AAGA56_15395, partial [Myxococcota bacterium]